jgi:hypothetical protein
VRHFLWMAVFAALTAAVFGVVAKGATRDRVIYGLKAFGEFMFIGLALAWILYFLPFK